MAYHPRETGRSADLIVCGVDRLVCTIASGVAAAQGSLEERDVQSMSAQNAVIPFDHLQYGDIQSKSCH